MLLTAIKKNIYLRNLAQTWTKRCLVGKSGGIRDLSRKATDRAGTKYPATSTASLIEMVWALQTPLAELSWLQSQPSLIFFMATHIKPPNRLLPLHLIRKHFLYPKLKCHCVQGEILKMLIQAICNSPNPVRLSKVNSHAGIPGNECTYSVANFQVTQVGTNHADTGMACAGIDGNPFHDMSWLAF